MPRSSTDPVPRAPGAARGAGEMRLFDAEAAGDAPRIEGLLEAFAGAALLLDRSGRVERLNAVARAATGLARGDDFLGQELGEGPATEVVRGELVRAEPICFPGRGREWRTLPIRSEDGRVENVCVSDEA